MRSGLDEHGFPEINFDSIETCRVTISRFGGTLLSDRLKLDNSWLTTLCNALDSVGSIVLWVNSSYMKYHEIYQQRESYIHAIVVNKYCQNTQTFDIFDPLIMDRVPISGHCILSLDDMQKALFTRIVGNQFAPSIGTLFYMLIDSSLQAPSEIRHEISRQALSNTKDELHRYAIQQYFKSCDDALSPANNRSRMAARRIFEIINVLFILPNMRLLQRALEEACYSKQTMEFAYEVEKYWRELSILALKYQATLDENILDRIQKKFKLIETQQAAFWKHLSAQ